MLSNHFGIFVEKEKNTSYKVKTYSGEIEKDWRYNL